jgi:lactate dehydrogenase-like 2-hydroxyacid dehydrogenase
MNIGILGTGDVGEVLAAGFKAVGCDVMIGTRAPASAPGDLRAFTSRGCAIEKLQRLCVQCYCENLGPTACATLGGCQRR